MARYSLFVLLLALSSLGMCIAEQVCTSRFDFEEKLLKKMVQLEHAMEIIKDDINKQQSKFVDERKAHLDDIKTFRDLIKIEQDDIKTEMTEAIENLNASLKKFMDEKDDIFNNNMDRMAALGDRIAFTATGELVAFSVKDPRSTLVDGIPIFSTILVNEGGAYDHHTGKFTCPVDGIYTFTFALRSTSNDYIYCYIQVNGKDTSYSIATGKNNMASRTTVVELTAKTVVNVGGCAQWENAYHNGVEFSGRLVAST